jgi:hypothetical protein
MKRLKQLIANLKWLATADLKQKETVLLEVRDLLGKSHRVQVVDDRPRHHHYKGRNKQQRNSQKP